MLKIRGEQMGLFSRPAYSDFEARAIQNLRGAFPKRLRKVDDPGLARFIRECVDHANEYGLKTEQAVICVAHLRVMTRDRLASSPRWRDVRRLLAREDHDPSERAKQALIVAGERIRRARRSRTRGVPDHGR